MFGAARDAAPVTRSVDVGTTSAVGMSAASRVPLVVRRVAAGVDEFEIIASERRWRAAQKAGIREVLVVVKDVTPKAAFELAIIENVQREDLNPIGWFSQAA